MGYKAGGLLFFPLLIMILAILLSSGSTPQLNATNPVLFCSADASQGPCTPSGTGTNYFCQPSNVIGFLQACAILPSCNIIAPEPAYCIGPNDFIGATGAGCLFQFIASGTSGCPVFLPANTNVFIPATTVATDLAKSHAFFSFTTSGTGGFISMIGVAVGLVSLAGLTVFGSSASSTESLHILFITGMLLGLWTILAGIEGFISGNPASIFAQLNKPIGGLGTFLYVMFGFMYVGGVIGSVTRGT